MTSPPGGGSCTRPKRASIGPARRIEARMRAHNCGSSSRGVAGRASTVTAFFPVHSTVAPRCVRRASIVSTSRIRGTLSSRQGPSASSVAARMGRAAFLLPAGRIVPWSGRPPETQNVDAMGCGKLRSEEHTSELQSRVDLVCRLLLEKKNKKKKNKVIGHLIKKTNQTKN